MVIPNIGTRSPYALPEVVARTEALDQWSESLLDTINDYLCDQGVEDTFRFLEGLNRWREQKLWKSKPYPDDMMDMICYLAMDSLANWLVAASKGLAEAEILPPE